MTAHSEFVTCKVEGRVATVVLSRPPVNAVTLEVYEQIRNVFDQIGRDGAADVVILCGEGKHFCAGNDLDEFRTMDGSNWASRMRTVRNAFFAISDCHIPVIAAVHGAVLGTGVALAASCDLIVASKDTQIGLPEIGVGVMGGARHLARLVPYPVVRWMLLSGESAPVTDLERYGGIHMVVDREALLETANVAASSITRHSPLAVRAAKRSLNQIEWMDVKSGYEFEQTLTGELATTRDAKEALLAVIERRSPRFEGR